MDICITAGIHMGMPMFMIVMVFMIKIAFNPCIFLPVVKVNIKVSSPDGAFSDMINMEVEAINSQFFEFGAKQGDISPKVNQ